MESSSPSCAIRPLPKRTLILAINGIRVKQDFKAWTRRFDWWLDVNLDGNIVAERYEYTCSAIFRFKGQRARVDELIELINTYKNDENFDYEIVLVGHSNGNDIIQRLLNLGIHVNEVHCFAPAAFEADFARAIRKKSFKRMFIYGSPKDKALRAARDASFLTRFLSFILAPFGIPHLGYGYLGLNGGGFASRFPTVVTDCSQPEFDHSTWFDDEQFDRTMSLFKANYLSSRTVTPPTTP